ncbi:MAG: recombinase RecT [Candidatus Omnitrophica bacterium]|nr:recombinase RecT [Candidatus Omnitrophota bacterium]
MTTENAVAKKTPETIGELLEQKKPELIALLPTHVPVERFIKSAILAVNRNPDLKKCSLTSVFTAIVNAAELGLDFTPAKRHAFMVPFRNGKTGTYEAQFMPGYGGLIHLAVQSGTVKRMEARIVFENDTFRVEYGTNPHIEHIPVLDGDPGKIKGAYAVAWFGDGTTQFEFIPKAGLDKIRNSSKAKDSPAYTQWLDEMSRKAPIKRLSKYIPSSPDDRLLRAIEQDNQVTGIVETEITSSTNRTADLANLISIEEAEFTETKPNGNAFQEELLAESQK